MRKLRNLAFAALLTAGALISAPREAAANPCNRCDLTGNCMACCRCDGGTIIACSEICDP